MPRDSIKIGFMPLADAAIPIVAARKGFGLQVDVDIVPVRETSWANIRDRLAVGDFDAAHLLAPMPVASALGLMPLGVPLVAPMALGLGGNAISVSRALWGEMQAACPDAVAGDPVSTGKALRFALTMRRSQGRAPPVLAVVHAFSAHNYELRYWLAASGIAPDVDIQIGIVPPPFMPRALESNVIDGFCVGEPWNTVAARQGSGVLILRKTDIWRASPEKVLGFRRDWAAEREDMVVRVTTALLQAAQWCGQPENRDELAQLLSASDVLDLPIERILPVLGAGGLEFVQNAATFPWLNHADWFGSQMVRWRQSDGSGDALRAAAQAYRPDLYRRAAAPFGLNVPAIDRWPAAGREPMSVPGTITPMMLYPSHFFDQPASADTQI